jgi:type II secretory pathway pseudopilin PulG
VLEVLVTVALIATVTGIGTPLVLHARDEQEGRQAARYLAGHLRAARQHAVLTGRHHAMVFDTVGDRWVFTVCVDEDEDGVSREDLVSGADTCRFPAQPLDAWFPRTTIDRAPSVPDLSGRVDSTAVMFGASRIASFSPLGSASSGTVVIRTRGGRHFAVRVAGVTGRVRVFRFAPEAGQWRDL